MLEGNMEDYFKLMLENKITDLNNPGCARCNECCALGTTLTEEEFLFLRRYLKNNSEGKRVYAAAKIRYYKNINPHIGAGVKLICPFSTQNKRCDIYKHRPAVCKAFHCKDSLRDMEYDWQGNRWRESGRTIQELFK